MQRPARYPRDSPDTSDFSAVNKISSMEIEAQRASAANIAHQSAG